MRLITVMVGNKVVAAFSSTRHKNFVSCIRSIAPGAKVRVKRSHYTPGIVTRKHPSREVHRVRQHTNTIGSYERVILLKPGEFTL